MDSLDLQLNGYRGVDFSADDLTASALRRACEAVRADGGGRMLATVITAPLDRMAARIARLAELRAADPLIADVMAGIHVEGPFISPLPGFVGAHPAAHVMPATISAAERLVSAGCGLVRLMTLAPEHDRNHAVIRWLDNQGILVSAGHCDPSADMLSRAIEAGLSACTHIGNACPLHMHRHDNILLRMLAAEGLRWVMVIADGVHLPPSLVRTIIRTVGVDRVIAVTDATAAGGMGQGYFSLGGQDVVVGADGTAWSADRSHLVGSTASMAQVRAVLRDAVGLSAADIEQVTAVNPTRAIAPCRGNETGGQ